MYSRRPRASRERINSPASTLTRDATRRCDSPEDPLKSRASVIALVPPSVGSESRLTCHGPVLDDAVFQHRLHMQRGASPCEQNNITQRNLPAADQMTHRHSSPQFSVSNPRGPGIVFNSSAHYQGAGAMSKGSRARQSEGASVSGCVRSDSRSSETSSPISSVEACPCLTSLGSLFRRDKR